MLLLLLLLRAVTQTRTSIRTKLYQYTGWELWLWEAVIVVLLYCLTRCQESETLVIERDLKKQTWWLHISHHFMHSCVSEIHSVWRNEGTQCAVCNNKIWVHHLCIGITTSSYFSSHLEAWYETRRKHYGDESIMRYTFRLSLSLSLYHGQLEQCLQQYRDNNNRQKRLWWHARRCWLKQLQF